MKEKKKQKEIKEQQVQPKEKEQTKSLAQQRVELQQEIEAHRKEEAAGEKVQTETGGKQSRKSRSGRYRMKPQTPKEKWQYFIDYYLLYVVIGVIGLAVAISLIKTMVFDRTEKVLSIVVMAYDQPDTEVMESELRDYLGIEEEDQTVSITCLTPGDYQTEMVMTTWIAAQDVDLIITDADTFESYAGKGYFMDLSETLDESTLKRVESDLKKGQTVEYDDQGEVSSYGEECDYGIGITLNEDKTDFTEGGDDWVLSICAGAKNKENALKAITYFLD